MPRDYAANVARLPSSSFSLKHSWPQVVDFIGTIGGVRLKLKEAAWPVACICTGVNVANILEATTQPAMTAPIPALSATSNQQTQSFSDSLHAASAASPKESSEAGAGGDVSNNKAARRTKSGVDDAKEEAAVVLPAVSAQTMLPQPIVLQQTAPVAVPVVATVTPGQVSSPGSVSLEDGASAGMGKLSADGTMASQPGTASGVVSSPSANVHGASPIEVPVSVKGLQVPMVFPQSETGSSKTVAQPLSKLSSSASAPASVSASAVVSNSETSVVQPSTDAAQNSAQSGVPKIALNGSALETASASLSQNHVPSLSEAVAFTPSEPMTGAVSQQAVTATASKQSSAIPSSPQFVAARSPVLPLASLPLGADTAGASVKKSAAALSLPVAGAASLSASETTSKKSAAVASLPVTATLPVVSAAADSTVKKIGSSSSVHEVPEQPVAAASTIDQSVGANLSNVSSGTAGQVASLGQAVGVISGTGKTGVSSANAGSAMKPNGTGVTASADGVSGAGGVKQQSATSATADAQTGSQSGTSSGSNDSSQADNVVQVQSAAMAQVNLATHVLGSTLHAQTMGVTSSGQPVSALSVPSATAGHVTAAPDKGVSAQGSETAAALPAINTAKVIQTMGQTEMRVGMRSEEFGAISIRTSTTRDLVSAQISLDHGDLAKVLATHVPEMQAKLGGGQTAEVRIDMNGQAAGQGSSSSMSNGSAEESRGGRQQGNNAASSGSSNTMSPWQPAVAAMATAALTGDGRLNSRLDVRV